MNHITLPRKTVSSLFQTTRRALSGTLSLIVFAGTAYAGPDVNIEFGGNVATSGTGVWNDTANWDIGNIPDSTDEIAVIRGGRTAIINTGESFHLSYTSIADTSFAGAAGTLIVQGGGELVHDGKYKQLIVGNRGTGTLRVTGSGSLVSATDMLLGYQAQGIMTIENGGTVRSLGDLGVNIGNGNSTINLNSGGTLELGGGADGLQKAHNGAFNFNFRGGTVKIINNDFTTTVVAGAVDAIGKQINGTLVSGFDSTFDTNGKNATWAGNFTSSGGLIKAGSGTLTLTGTNSYTGTTAINGGTLSVKGGGLATTAVSVNSGATLSGGGNITGSVSVSSGGTLSPGNSPGNPTYGSVTLGAAGNYNWQILDATGSAGTAFDQITVTGALDLSALSTSLKYNINLWSLSATGPDVSGNASNFNSGSDQSWTLFSAGSINTSGLGTINDYFAVNTGAVNGTDGFSNSYGGLFSVSVVGNDLRLNYSVVPEPSTFTLLAAGLGLALTARRKRQA